MFLASQQYCTGMKEELRKEIENTRKLLATEKEEDLKQYKERMQSSSFTERRKSGVCWYPVALEKAKYNTAERVIVRILRHREHKESHLFQSGKLISFFTSDAYEDEKCEVNGVVNQVGEHDMLITLNCDALPDWAYGRKLGVQLLFDENSYREMERGLKKLLTSDDERLQELVRVLIGDQNAGFNNTHNITLPNLNAKQNLAVSNILNANEIAIVHGPPGTGKTTTLVEAILELLRSETQVLVTAPSNAAVDLLVEKLSERMVSVVRIGHPARVTPGVLNNTLDTKITAHQQYKQLKTLRKSADEFRRLAHKYKRNFGKTEREQRRLMFAEADRSRYDADQLSQFIKEDILDKARVIACTLVGSANDVLRDKQFSTVIIDEAAQGLEPASWLPILRANKVVFAGDHCQLPPTIKSFEAAKKGLSSTLFEKAIQRNNADVMLTEQYRMHESIMNFSSQFFYKNALTANSNVASDTILPEDLPVEFIDTAGCGFYEKANTESKSAFNPEEAGLLFKHLASYMENLANINKTEEVQNIGVISPYKAQIDTLQEFFDQSELKEQEWSERLQVKTIDSFQGQERDIIYISLVRSNEKGEIGFLSDTRRMNVAMTRAKRKLVIIGDSGTIGNHEFYSQFLNYIESIGAYKSAFEYISYD